VYQQNLANRYFRSRRKGKDGIEKPWLEKKDPRQRWLSLFPLFGIIIGVALSGYLVYDGLASVETAEYCPVYEDDFTNGFNEKIWTKEVEVGGFGNGQFDQCTGTDENVFVKDGTLTIKPTLQDPKLIETNNIINLTASGLCTGHDWKSCVVSTNTTNGTIVNPAKSARINTKKGASIQYGRVEVVAKLPAGDWLWPAIWMLPVNDTYGSWPTSGEVCGSSMPNLSITLTSSRSISPSREETIGLIKWVAGTLSVQHCIGVLTLAMMLGGGPIHGRMHCTRLMLMGFVRVQNSRQVLTITNRMYRYLRPRMDT
jgi:hypothetical protein